MVKFVFVNSNNNKNNKNYYNHNISSNGNIYNGTTTKATPAAASLTVVTFKTIARNSSTI